METYAALIQTYGIQIVMLAWFMFRMEKILNNNTQAILGFRDVIQTCKKK